MKLRLQKVFCAVGGSQCEVQDKGCYCPRCQVARDHQLEDTYYCRSGSKG